MAQLIQAKKVKWRKGSKRNKKKEMKEKRRTIIKIEGDRITENALNRRRRKEREKEKERRKEK